MSILRSLQNSDPWKIGININLHNMYMLYIILLTCKFNKESIYLVFKIKIKIFFNSYIFILEKNVRYFGDVAKKSFAISVLTVYLIIITIY